jgi:hypothetical protein
MYKNTYMLISQPKYYSKTTGKFKNNYNREKTLILEQHYNCEKNILKNKYKSRKNVQNVC